MKCTECDEYMVCGRGNDLRRKRSRCMKAKQAPKPITNYDRIISKTPEELARYMTEVQMYAGCPNDGAMDCRDNCALCWLDWLKQEVTE